MIKLNIGGLIIMNLFPEYHCEYNSINTTVYPDYYKEFKCINSNCKHNCCIGWDIYIDENTADKYKNITNEFSNKIFDNIDFNEEPHFILKENKRCPFLNNDNLCDIIINLGEEHLCDICKRHPRFINELPGRIEIGLGLSCEEAARIVLSKKEPTNLIYNGDNDTTDEILLRRSEIFEVLQDRSLTISQRLDKLIAEENAYIPDKTFEEWIDLFLSFERLDDNWSKVLLFLKDNYENTDYCGFKEYINNRMYEYEQFIVYLIYRYYANCFDLDDASAVLVFSKLCNDIIYTIGASIWSLKGSFKFEEQVELIRLFSAEIEYSDTIMERIWDELYNY